MALVIPFPLARRRRLISTTVARIALATSATGERYLAQALHVQAESMLRRGIPPDVVAGQLRAFEGAVRAEVWKRSFTPGGAA
jgi:hypothetical protein